MMTEPVAYTDGACLGNPGPGGWGVRILYPSGEVCELGGSAAATTNNRMELQAAIAALQALTALPHVTVLTDSRYVIDGLTKWLPSWRRRGWMTATQTPVKNQDLWMQLDRLAHAGVTWKHVRGHSGHPQNERVDTIARGYAAGTRPPLFQGEAGAPTDPVGAHPNVREDITPVESHAVRRPQESARFPTRYISLVQGVLTLDPDWATCAARVLGVAGARYRKVQTPQDIVAFCKAHGVALPPTFDVSGANNRKP